MAPTWICNKIFKAFRSENQVITVITHLIDPSQSIRNLYNISKKAECMKSDSGKLGHISCSCRHLPRAGLWFKLNQNAYSDGYYGRLRYERKFVAIELGVEAEDKAQGGVQ